MLASCTSLVGGRNSSDVVCTLALKKHNTYCLPSAWSGVGCAGNWRENGAISGGRKTVFRALGRAEIGSGNLFIGPNLARAEIGKLGNRAAGRIATWIVAYCRMSRIVRDWAFRRYGAVHCIRTPYHLLVWGCGGDTNARLCAIGHSAGTGRYTASGRRTTCWRGVVRGGICARCSSGRGTDAPDRRLGLGLRGDLLV